MNLNSSTKCRFCGFLTTPITDGGFKLHKCQNCGLIFKDQIDFLNPSQEMKRYNQHSIDPDDGYLKSINDFISFAIDPFPEIKTILDYGCGRIGYLGSRLSDIGYQVSEYDLYYQQNQLVLENQYDLVCTVEVIEHFQNPKVEFARLCQLVKTNGYLAIKTQFVPIEFKNWWYIRDTTHYSFFSNQTFVYIAATYGLKIVLNDHIQTIVYQKK
ncbi:MAG: class I SAM-dependent methyltransferase [Candidatus Izemoplasmatales bacterium]